MYIDMGLLYWTKGCTPGGRVRGRGILEKGVGYLPLYKVKSQWIRIELWRLRGLIRKQSGVIS